VAWEFELIADGFSLTEGPAWDGYGLVFTDINNGRIMRYDADSGEITVFHPESERTNGLMFDPEGRLYGCSQNRGAIVRFEPDGAVTTVVGEFEGKRLNSPNDLAIDDQGRIWFTDPRYDDLAPPTELDHMSVYRLDRGPDGDWSIDRVTFDATRPNGILVSPDQSELYVAQSDPTEGAKRELRAYPIRENGVLGRPRVVHNFFPYRGIDGMCFDTEGHIVATTGNRAGGPGPMITVFEQSGRIVETHPLPVDSPTNCTFGGPDLSTLYVTTIGGHLLRAETDRRGQLLYPPA